MNSAVLIDKPSGMTSMDVIRKARKKANIKRIGHAGTLDPLATGLLVLLFGKATKLQDIFQNATKGYTGTIQLGLSTETLDVDGKEHVLKDVPSNIQNNSEVTLNLIEKFSGTYFQLPPQYSALKVSGVSSHKLARQGIEVELKKREVTIEFKKLEFSSNDILSFDVICSKGTYIRSLARDIGVELGCGACIKTLRRTLSSPFTLNETVSLDSFLEDDILEHLVDISKLVSHLPKIEVSPEQLRSLQFGKQEILDQVSISSDKKLAAIFSENSFGGLAYKKDSGEDAGAWRIKFIL